MPPHKFIRKRGNIHLQKEGTLSGICMIIADEALVLYKQKQTSQRAPSMSSWLMPASAQKKWLSGLRNQADLSTPPPGHDREKNIHVYRTAPINY